MKADFIISINKFLSRIEILDSRFMRGFSSMSFFPRRINTNVQLYYRRDNKNRIPVRCRLSTASYD